MSIKINDQATTTTLTSNLRKSTEEQTKSLTRLSSGKRIQSAADDAAGLSLSKKMEAYIASQRQASRNANDGLSFIQTAEGSMGEISNILVRLRELTVQAASDTVGQSEREFLNREYQQLVEEVDRIAATTSFNGTNVLNNSEGVLDFQVGAFSTENDRIQFDNDVLQSDANRLGISGSGIESKDDALESIAGIDEAINTVSGQRSELGARQSRLQIARNNLDMSIISHEQAKSTIEDADIAEEAARLASNGILTSAGTSAVAMHSNMSSKALKLIG